MDMRDHLSAISEIQVALAGGRFNLAANIAEDRIGLGSSSSEACRMPDTPTYNEKESTTQTNNYELSKFMPEAMHKIGFNMHAAADQFARDARKAAKTQNYQMTIASLSKITTQCVACHTKFKLNNR